jgi:hypothetical membrane protein
MQVYARAICFSDTDGFSLGFEGKTATCRPLLYTELCTCHCLTAQVLSLHGVIWLSMAYSNSKVAGTLVLIGVAQFAIGVIVSEALYPNYSVADNYISDLGVGPSALIFNSSAFLMGLLLLVGAYFLQRAFRFELLTVMIILTAVGVMGVGVFTEDFGVLHVIASLIAFLFSGLSAIFSVLCSRVHGFPLVKMPFSAISIVLGLMTLAALALLGGGVLFGLGVGGMERMIAYPAIMWGAGFGGYLIAYPEERRIQQKPQ